MATATASRKHVADGGPSGSSPRSIAVASGGLRTTQDLKDLGLAIAEDVLCDDMCTRKANAGVRAALMPLRVADFEYRHGGETITLGSSRRDVPDDDPLTLRERQIEEELAAVRKEKSNSLASAMVVL